MNIFNKIKKQKIRVKNYYKMKKKLNYLKNKQINIKLKFNNFLQIKKKILKK